MKTTLWTRRFLALACVKASGVYRLLVVAVYLEYLRSKEHTLYKCETKGGWIAVSLYAANDFQDRSYVLLGIANQELSDGQLKLFK